MLIVNGEPVDPQLIESAFLRIKGEQETLSNASCCEHDDAFLADAREEAIRSILLAQEIERRQIAVSEDTVRTQLLETLRGLREKGFAKDLIESKREELENDIRSDLRTAAFMDEISASIPAPDEAEIQAYYDAHPEQFHSPEEVHLLHCMKSLVGIHNPQPLYQEMRSLRQQVRQGGNFASLASEATEKSNRQVDLGWIPFERHDNPFEIMAFSLEINEISPVFLYERCLHLVLPINLRPAQSIPLEEARKTISEQILVNKRRDAIRSLTTELRQKADIEEKDLHS